MIDGVVHVLYEILLSPLPSLLGKCVVVGDFGWVTRRGKDGDVCEWSKGLVEILLGVESNVSGARRRISMSSSSESISFSDNDNDPPVLLTPWSAVWRCCKQTNNRNFLRYGLRWDSPWWWVLRCNRQTLRRMTIDNFCPFASQELCTQSVPDRRTCIRWGCAHVSWATPC